MKISFVGSGYVGLVSGTCLAELGNNIVCLDKDDSKINLLNQDIIPIYEDGLLELVKKNKAEGRLRFSSEVEEEISDSDIVFIAVGTPSNDDGSANLTYVFSVAELIAKHGKDGVIVVTKSTVPVGTGGKIKELISKTNPTLKFRVASNPEFLREGSAVKDFMNPDRILIGIESNENDAFDKISSLYKRQTEQGFRVIKTDIKSAELAKYAANAFLAMRVAFINEIADLCEISGANVENVAEAIGADHRIGKHFLKAGPGFGGSCFPKDTRALANIADNYNYKFQLVDATIEANEKRKSTMAEKIISACEGDVKGKNIAILGVTFKANTDDIRESPALPIIEILASKGANLFLFDPQGLEHAKNYFEEQKTPNLKFCPLVAEALFNAETTVIITEWEQFKNINYSVYKDLKNIVDLRNIVDASKIAPSQKLVQVGK